jgi:hypothetical protein
MELELNDFHRMAVEEFDTTKLLAHASRQARDRGYDKFPIVDVDSHHYENESHLGGNAIRLFSLKLGSKKLAQVA